MVRIIFVLVEATIEIRSFSREHVLNIDTSEETRISPTAILASKSIYLKKSWAIP